MDENRNHSRSNLVLCPLHNVMQRSSQDEYAMRTQRGLNDDHDFHTTRQGTKIEKRHFLPTIYVTPDGEITEKIHRKQRITKREISKTIKANEQNGTFTEFIQTYVVLERIDAEQGELFK